jgi:SAM-dependent methyltransferase
MSSQSTFMHLFGGKSSHVHRCNSAAYGWVLTARALCGFQRSHEIGWAMMLTILERSSMPDREQEAVEWQTGVWKRMSSLYHREWDKRFAPIVDSVIGRAKLNPGESVLDLGCGTGSIALGAAGIVGPTGQVIGIDLSNEMLEVARERASQTGAPNLIFKQGRAESIPVPDQSFDVVLTSLTLMYVIDRATAAKEIARVLRPGGRLIAAVWGGPSVCDIVQFQQTAGAFAKSPPVPGLGPGALADTAPLLRQLGQAGISGTTESEAFSFEFSGFKSAWDAMAGVTSDQLSEERRHEAQSAILRLMYKDGDGPRIYNNLTQFIVGLKT